ncbi:MAG: phosphoglucomutase/phosphomannomutase family protein [Saprospiraceae bacterium]|nr:phosphoglucomutase/phosphomannomutase family protein [Saprospiraceae bacterium]
MGSSQIKFGTDGWRAIIAKDYTVDNVKRVSEATARWMMQKQMKSVVIGFDCRFGGQLFSETAAQVFGNFNIKVYYDKNFVSTPMVSLGVVKLNADMGVVITASHNPPSYNGFKLKSAYGGPTIPSDIADVEAIIPEDSLGKLPSLNELEEGELIEYVNLEQMYMDHVEASFDLDLIRNSGMVLAYDAMYGAGQNVIRRLFPDAHLLHAEYNPSFHGQAPEPIHRNLTELSELIKSSDSINVGLANDGDADRIGLYNSKGEFVDSHHILLLLLYYLKEYKNYDGEVIITFSVTNKMKQLAAQYGLNIQETKIGFKYIAEIMTKDDVLVGGEESGGLAVKGHINERDGIWIGLIIMEFMAKTGKSLEALIEDVYAKVGAFKFDRDDLHIEESKKWAIMDRCKSGAINSIGGRSVKRTEDLDGYKFYLTDDEWLMVRPSGTEPVLRVYAHAADQDAVKQLLSDGHKALQEGI